MMYLAPIRIGNGRSLAAWVPVVLPGLTGEEAAVGVLPGQVGHPSGPDVLGLPESEVEVSLLPAK